MHEVSAMKLSIAPFPPWRRERLLWLGIRCVESPWNMVPHHLVHEIVSMGIVPEFERAAIEEHEFCCIPRGVTHLSGTVNM